jgi:hypothetical protein
MEEKEKSVREITAELNLPKFKNAARYWADLGILLSLYTTVVWNQLGPRNWIQIGRKRLNNYVLKTWMFSLEGWRLLSELGSLS